MRLIAPRIVALLVLSFAGVAGAQQKVVTLSGTVVDSLKRPIANAEVSIEGLNLLKPTNDKGVFMIDNVPAGVHRVSVRKIGFARLDTTVAFREDQDVEWRVTMRELVVTLDSVIVSAPVDPLMREFEENRKRGFGRFRTRAELAKVDGVSLPNVMRSMQGADIIRTTGSAAYMTSKRAPISGCGPPNPKRMESYQQAREEQERVDQCLRRERVYYVPDDGELRQGVMRACYPLVFIDRQLMTPGRPTPPFDIGGYATEQIEAIEWYESESQTPPKFSVNNARCGVMVVHIRKKK